VLVVTAGACVDLGALEGGNAMDGRQATDATSGDATRSETGSDASQDQQPTGPGEGGGSPDGPRQAGSCGTGTVPSHGASAVVARDAPGPTAIVTAAGYVYWTNGDSVHKAAETSRTSGAAAPGTCVVASSSAPRTLNGLFASATTDELLAFGSGPPAGGGPTADCCTFFGSPTETGECGLSTSYSCIGWANDGTNTFVALSESPSMIDDLLFVGPVGVSDDLDTGTSLGQGEGILPAMAANDGTLYFATSGGAILSITTAGGASKTLATGQTGILAMATNGLDLYWLLSTGVVLSMAIDSSIQPAPTTFATVPSVTMGASLYAGSFALYVTNGDDAVYAIVITTGYMSALAKSQAQPRGVYVDTDETPKAVYWANFGDGTIMVAPAE